VKRKILAVLASTLLVSSAWATDLKLRNVQLVDAGHITSIVGTVVNTSDHMVKGSYLDFEVTRKGQVVARETVEVPEMAAGQAWRISQPVQHDSTSGVITVRAHDPQLNVSASVVPYPETLVSH
jgi:hypothetical protein